MTKRVWMGSSELIALDVPGVGERVHPALAIGAVSMREQFRIFTAKLARDTADINPTKEQGGCFDLVIQWLYDVVLGPFSFSFANPVQQIRKLWRVVTRLFVLAPNNERIFGN